jgi:bifunctional non-homologous end joining protein LigD
LVACDDRGQPDFGGLQLLLAKRAVTARLSFYLFDLPYLLERDLRHLPLAARRRTLETILAVRPDPFVRFSGELEGYPEQLLEAACDMGLEGIMCKRADSAYWDGRRSPAWRKLKCRQHADLVIGGDTGARGLDKVLLGAPGSDGLLRYAGSVGTGLSEIARVDLYRALQMIATPKSPLSPSQAPSHGKWVNPILVAEISFAERTKGGKVRHSALHGVKVR